MKSGIWAALGAAVLFGLSTPLAKLLTGQASPLLLAGLLYTGSGIGITLLLVVRAMVGGRACIVLPRRVDLGWLLGATLFGGAIGPYLLMYGLQATDSASASLILNLEGVFSALLHGSFSRKTSIAELHSVWHSSSPAGLCYRPAQYFTSTVW